MLFLFPLLLLKGFGSSDNGSQLRNRNFKPADHTSLLNGSAAQTAIDAEKMHERITTLHSEQLCAIVAIEQADRAIIGGEDGTERGCTTGSKFGFQGPIFFFFIAVHLSEPILFQCLVVDNGIVIKQLII